MRKAVQTRTAASRATESKQIVQRHGLAPLVLLKSFPRHATDYLTFLDEALFRGVFVGQLGQDLGRDRVLLVLWQYDYLLQRLFQ